MTETQNLRRLRERNRRRLTLDEALKSEPARKTTLEGDDVLVFASDAKISIMPDISNPVVRDIAERDESIYALCFHDGRLYDGCNSGQLYETLRGINIWTYGERKINAGGAPIMGLCSYEGELHIARIRGIMKTH